MWRFELIGRFTVCRDHARIDRFPTEKTALLLARLVFSRGAQARKTLAAELWPGVDTDDARNRLRTALAWLRSEVEGKTEEPLFDAGRQTLGLHTSRISSDCFDFQEHLKRATEAAEPAEKRGHLGVAAALVRGPLLEGLTETAQRPELDWLTRERSRWNARCAALFGAIARLDEMREAWNEAHDNVLRALEFEPDNGSIQELADRISSHLHRYAHPQFGELRPTECVDANNGATPRTPPRSGHAMRTLTRLALFAAPFTEDEAAEALCDPGIASALTELRQFGYIENARNEFHCARLEDPDLERRRTEFLFEHDWLSAPRLALTPAGRAVLQAQDHQAAPARREDQARYVEMWDKRCETITELTLSEPVTVTRERLRPLIPHLSGALRIALAQKAPARTAYRLFTLLNWIGVLQDEQRFTLAQEVLASGPHCRNHRLELMLHLASREKNPPDSSEIVHTTAIALNQGEPSIRVSEYVRILMDLGTRAHHAERHTIAREAHQAAVDLCIERAPDDHWSIIWAYAGLFEHYLLFEDYVQAQHHLDAAEERLQAVRAADNPSLHASQTTTFAYRRGCLLRKIGAHAEAERYLSSAARSRRCALDFHGEADALLEIASLYLEQERPVEAEAMIRRAIALYERIPALESRAAALLDLGDALMLLGEEHAAKTAWSEGHAVWKAKGHQRWTGRFEARMAPGSA